jgi:hypothetical protein
LAFGKENRVELNRINLSRPDRSLIGIIDMRQVNFGSGGFTVTIVIPPLTPRIVCGVDAVNQRVAFGINNLYTIRQVGFTGSKHETFSLDREPVALTKKMKKRVNKEMKLSKKMWDRLPKTLTHFSHIQFESGHILVHVMVFEDQGPTRQIDVFSPEGRYLYRAIFSAAPGEEISTSFEYPFVLKGSHIYAVIQDDDGDMKVVKYTITAPWLENE